MKNIYKYLLALLLVAVSMTSCKDQLREKVYSELLSSNAYETAEDAEALITSVYVALRGDDWGAYYEYDYLSIGEAPTDTYGLDAWSPGTYKLEMGTWDNNFLYIINLWNGAYKTIGAANFALNILEGMDLEESVKNRYIGEAKFLRGLAYYDLAFNFGDAIINVGESTGNLPLSPQSEVIAQAISDFTDAISLLPEADVVGTPGRASKGAALGMRAKAYLNSRQWAQAEADADAVMKLGDYELMPSVEELFLLGNKAANEWIFVVMSTTEEGTGALSQIPWFTLSLSYMNGGWGRMTLAPEFYKSFDMDDERRKLMANGYQAGNKRVVDGKDRWYALPGTPEYDPLANDPAIDLYDLNSVTATKYMGGADRFVYTGVSWLGVNYPVLRYADIILTRAEALNEQGKTGEAIPLLNQIRTRSNLPELSGLDQDALRDAIFEERGKEFFMEGQRRIDLLRQGKNKYVQLWKANLENKYPGENFNYLEQKDLFFPIPQKEIDANDQISND